MPALPRNCYRTQHGFIFRIVVPESLRPVIGKREIKKSLGRDYRQAVSEAHRQALKADLQFTEARERLNRDQGQKDGLDAYLALPPDQRTKLITEVTPELVASLRSLWLSSLDADLSRRNEGLEDEDFDELDQNIAQIKAVVAQALARGRPEPFIPMVRGLLYGRGYELAISPAEERQLVLGILPAIQESYDLLEQRQAGRRPEVPVPEAPQLRAAWEAPARTEAGFTWSQLLEHWHQDRSRPARTIQEVETYVKSLSEHLPKASPATLTRAQVTEWLRHERETRGNSAKTLEKKGTLIGALFSVALKDELLEKNPFAGFDYSRFAVKEGIEDPDERDPFNMEQLKLIFASDEGIFSVTKEIGGGGYHARVWMPLIALYTGARLDEIGRILVADVMIEPVPYFRIRKGKNSNSIRDVPLHPKLIELGFLKYIEAIRKAGHETLWPLLRTRSSKASNSEVHGKWFNRYIHETLGLPNTVVFHSFRHTFKDFCRDALIPRDLHQALTGHSKDTVGDNYGKGYAIETKYDQIQKIVLDLDIPRPKPYGASHF